jgi:hypothetical protein
VKEADPNSRGKPCAAAATVALLLAACGSGDGSNDVSADVPSTEAELANAAALAGEAAADEAADMNNFGGNAAAMDVANSR